MILVLIVLLIVLELAAVAYENTSWAFVILFLVGLVLEFRTDVEVVHTLVESLADGTFWLYLFGYFVVGTVWSFFKFYVELKKWSNKYKRVVQSWEEKDHSNLSKETQYDSKNSYLLRSVGTKPILKTYRKSTINWILWWPFSLVWTMIDDFVRKLGSWIYDSFIGIYKRIYKNVIESLNIGDGNGQ